jgi:nicotinamide-nucleotide amidase
VSSAPNSRAEGPAIAGKVSPGPRAQLLSIGTELTDGVIQNTHFRYLGSQLKSLGFRMAGGLQLPDELEPIRRALGGAEAELLVVTGGLGPTSDDLTREAVAGAAGVALEFHPELWQALRERFASSGGEPPESNRRQAHIPAGFEVLPNDRGTAPGFWGRLPGRGPGAAPGPWLAALPGPPAELEPMFLRRLVPLLAAVFPGIAGGAELAATSLLLPESALEDGLRRFRHEGIAWGTRVAEDHIAFSLRGGREEEREAVLAALQGQFGSARLRRGFWRPCELLFRALELRGEQAALAESCTGGLAAKWLTDLPGASRVFWGGVAAYSDEAKERLLGVPRAVLERHGAVSAQAAEGMARGLLERSPAHLAAAVTGIAGPEGGSAEKPVGTVWIAALHRDGRGLARRFLFSGGRDLVRRRSAVATLLAAECLLSGQELPQTL